MKKTLAILFIIVVVLQGCKNNTTSSPTEFGETDSLTIANDTSMQVAIENSYEFLQTLTSSANEVYDIKSSSYFEGIVHNKFLILRRTKSNVEDTLCAKNYPTDIIRAELVDLDKDKEKEIIVYYNTTTADKNFSHIASGLVCKPNRKGHKDFISEISSGVKDLKYKSSDAIHDTLYVKDNLIVREYPLYEHRKDSLPKGKGWIYYQLKVGGFEEIKKETIL